MEGQTGKRLDVEFGKKQGRRISPSSGLCLPREEECKEICKIFFGEERFVAKTPCQKNGLGYIVGCVLELVTICCSKYCIVFCCYMIQPKFYVPFLFKLPTECTAFCKHSDLSFPENINRKFILCKK